MVMESELVLQREVGRNWQNSLMGVGFLWGDESVLYQIEVVLEQLCECTNAIELF